MSDQYLNPSGVSKFWDKTKQLIESSGSSGITKTYGPSEEVIVDVALDGSIAYPASEIKMIQSPGGQNCFPYEGFLNYPAAWSDTYVYVDGGGHTHKGFVLPIARGKSYAFSFGKADDLNAFKQAVEQSGQGISFDICYTTSTDPGVKDKGLAWYGNGKWANSGLIANDEVVFWTTGASTTMFLTIYPAMDQLTDAVKTSLSKLRLVQRESLDTPSLLNIRNISAPIGLSLQQNASTKAEIYSCALPSASYGGAYNWTTGEVSITHKKFTLNVSDMDNTEDKPGWTYVSGLDQCFPSNYNSWVLNATLSIGTQVSVDMSTSIVYLPTGSYKMTQSEWKAKYPNLKVEIVFVLQEPQVIMLPPNNVRIFSGVNSFEADEGKISVTFTVDPEKYFQRAQPVMGFISFVDELVKDEVYLLTKEEYLGTPVLNGEYNMYACDGKRVFWTRGKVTEILSDMTIKMKALNDPEPFTENVPAGGTTGQVLSKSSNEDYAVEWIDPPQGGSATNSVNASIGSIMAWSGTADDVPEGWHICNGEDGTINLQDMFILGAGPNHAVGTTGGSEEVVLSIEQMPKHTHSYTRVSANKPVNNGNQTSASAWDFMSTDTSEVGSSQPHPNMPPYYALLYIQKIGETPTDYALISDIDDKLAPVNEKLITTLIDQNITSYYQTPPGVYHLKNCQIVNTLNVSDAVVSVSAHIVNNTIDKIYYHFVDGTELIATVNVETKDLAFEIINSFEARVNDSLETPVKSILTQEEYDALPEEQQNKGLYVISDGGSVSSPGEVYSTEETRIGTWVDGKPLYRKVLSVNSPNVKDSNVAVYNLGGFIDWVSNMYGILKSKNSEFIPVPTAPRQTGSRVMIFAQLSGGSCNVMCSTDTDTYLGCSMTIVVEYTKNSGSLSSESLITQSIDFDVDKSNIIEA